MEERGFWITLQAIRRQLAAMPCELYLVRLIHNRTHNAFPGERLWSNEQLASAPVVRFLRARNCEGCDVYIHPYAGNKNAGYILVDLDHASADVIAAMRVQGHDPCVIVQTSAGHLQAWIRLSFSPLEPGVATAAARRLAQTYGGDPASADWRHLGRLAGFTNRKPARRAASGVAPWVKVRYAHVGLAPGGAALLESIRRSQPPPYSDAATPLCDPATADEPGAAEALAIYSDCLRRWRILERFPRPDWSIVDLWVARRLLAQFMPAARVEAILRLASPHFPRRHGDPEDYLRRTVARAALPPPARTVCHPHTRASTPPAANRACSNSTGGR